MIHSPCYLQEIEAISLAAEGKPDVYMSAAAAIEEKIRYCKGHQFKNADGVENHWAEGKLCSTVKMNPENLAATTNAKSGWPKLVIFTFWNDPSNPEKGGYNYSHMIYFPFVEILPKEWSDKMPGGSILCGKGGGGGIDLGHHAEHADINEWLPIVTEALNKMAGMKSDPISYAGQLKYWVERFKKLAQDAEKITSKAKEMDKAIDENNAEKEAKEKSKAEKSVSISGNEFETDKEYRFYFKDADGKEGNIVAKPGYFKENQMNRGYQYVKHDNL